MGQCLVIYLHTQCLFRSVSRSDSHEDYFVRVGVSHLKHILETSNINVNSQTTSQKNKFPKTWSAMKSVLFVGLIISLSIIKTSFVLSLLLYDHIKYGF